MQSLFIRCPIFRESDRSLILYIFFLVVVVMYIRNTCIILRWCSNLTGLDVVAHAATKIVALVEA